MSRGLGDVYKRQIAAWSRGLRSDGIPQYVGLPVSYTHLTLPTTERV
ncbi:hypothetical protein JMUB7531_28760 [Staphylococcus aureus]